MNGDNVSTPAIDATTGWSSPHAPIVAKLAALKVLDDLPDAEPLQSISFASAGRLLIVGPAARVAAWLPQLADALDVACVVSDAPLPPLAAPVGRGRVTKLEGYLGHFTVDLAIDEPGSLRLVRRVATSEGEVEKVVAAKPGVNQAVFDLVLDLDDSPLIDWHTPPLGYQRRASATPDALIVQTLKDFVGEFEKPKYFAYREKLCAHSRSQKTGCTRCIDVCSTHAIRSAGDKVEVNPNLCMGCGACATVCPSGAMTYQYPRVPDLGERLRKQLRAYREAGGTEAIVLFHNMSDGRAALAAHASAGEGLPANVIPVELWHTASVGLDTLLGALAYGANRVAVLMVGSESPEYQRATEFQMSVGAAILAALGYVGEHFRRIDAAGLARLPSWPSAGVPAAAATFALSAEKRTSLEFSIEHFAKHAPNRIESIPLPPGSPYGQVHLDKQKCTLCLACVGACPASALMDNPERPMVRFVERNCVQCGLCTNTCPEDALRLESRLLLTPAVREPRTLNEAEPFHCVSCGKPFGTKQIVENMLAKLTGHSMFAGDEALKRLQMCADCRVVDMMANKRETSIFDIGKR